LLILRDPSDYANNPVELGFDFQIQIGSQVYKPAADDTPATPTLEPKTEYGNQHHATFNITASFDLMEEQEIGAIEFVPHKEDVEQLPPSYLVEIVIDGIPYKRLAKDAVEDAIIIVHYKYKTE